MKNNFGLPARLGHRSPRKGVHSMSTGYTLSVVCRKPDSPCDIAATIRQSASVWSSAAALMKGLINSAAPAITSLGLFARVARYKAQYWQNQKVHPVVSTSVRENHLPFAKLTLCVRLRYCVSWCYRGTVRQTCWRLLFQRHGGVISSTGVWDFRTSKQYRGQIAARCCSVLLCSSRQNRSFLA